MIREGSRDARDEKYERQEPGAGETARLCARDAGAAEARPRSTHGPRCARSGTALGVPPRDRLSRASQNQIFPRKRDGAFPSVGADHAAQFPRVANRREPRDGACGATQTSSTASLARRALGVGALSVGEGENFDGDDGKRLRNSQE